ncbi:MAG: hypothetical protein HQL48_02705 [Gammaproteobacteria bacterium]|nr:hypothetical protein [Gammaproteobacteria bacterium]
MTLTVIPLALITALVWYLSIGSEERGLSIEDFLQQHWRYPIPAQGVPPSQWSELEASLDPQSCATCHPQQHIHWEQSLHRHAMGPGILWQLQLADIDTARSCLRCHAPMSEQLALLSQQRGWTDFVAKPPNYISPNLHQQGLVCAVCHLRSHQHYGPPAKSITEGVLPHSGFKEHQAFGDSRFCANCHQFASDGPRLNGKLREDTYQQWSATLYADNNQQCQYCHMPDRQHLWKGIHDREMTQSALSVNIELIHDDEKINAVASITNSGAGHHFPTYLVPEILLRLEHVTADGAVIEIGRRIIAWRANLSLTEELFDQRLASGEQITIQAESDSAVVGDIFRLRVNVSPREHYIRTFEDYLSRHGASLSGETLALLRQAITEGKQKRFEFVATTKSVSDIAN